MNHVTVSSSPVKVTLRYGQKGERGIGISNVALDDNAHLIITYDDGKTQDAGAALGDVASVKDGIDSSYKKIQASETNVTKLEASTKVNADKAQQALQDTQSASASGVNAINTLVSEKMTYMTSTFNSLLTQAKANIDQWERDAENKIHKVRTYSLEQIKTAHDDAMVAIERSVNKAEAWAVSETTPDKEPDFESPTGLTQSSRSWALLSKKKVQEAYDTLKDIKDNETNVSNMKNDVAELLRKTQASEQNTHDYMNAASDSQKAAKESEKTAEAHMENAKTSEVNAKASETASADSASKAHTSEVNAKTSETKSASSASSASNSATAAASSATSASTSATNAKAYMNTANTAASSANTSATSASTSASNAAKAEIAAKTAQAAAEKARDDANIAVDKVTGVMRYAGQVNNYSDLANVTKNTGDVWNIVNADPAHGIKAGDNVAWNGTDWDNLSGTVDLSIYAEKADYQKVITSATANGATITFNHKDGTTSTATVNNVASATAATNDAKGQKIDTTYEKVADASNVHTSLQNSINSLSTNKQDKLTFDTAPIADSTNPVTSGGIKTALDGKPSNTGAGASGTWPISVSGNANTATKLSTARAIQTNLASTSSASFNGTANVTPGVTGILPVANGGTGANSLASITVGKATADASGNVITTTYATKAYADKVAKAAEDKAQDLYNQLYLPRYNLYIRSALPTSAKTSITINPMALTINDSTYDLIDAKTLSLSDSSSWDRSTYATAANRAGKDFYIYACQPTSGTSPNIILSANSTVPTGYNALTSRKIGGFHCECLNVGTVTDGNPMNGYATGDIIPYSIWDLKHRPKCSPEGMVYVEPLNIWISIYLMSWDGSKLVSTYNGVQADGASAKKFSGTEFAEYLAKVNMRLPKYDEYVIFSKGIEECINVKGSTDVNTTGGHYTTNNKRIVSNYGIEDCAGVAWQWLSDVFGSDFSSSWNTSSNRDARNIRGDCWGGGLRRALAGGSWVSGAFCGSRAASVGGWSAVAGDGAACRGASEPLVFEY